MNQQHNFKTQLQKLLSFSTRFKPQKTGSIPCLYCGQTIEIETQQCPHCKGRFPGLGGYTPLVQKLGTDLGFVSIVTWGCLVLYISTLLFNIEGIGGGNAMSFLSPNGYSLLFFGSTGAIPVFQLGRWWTIVSAAWLHGSLLHIGFNLGWIRYLAPSVAKGYGGSRLVIIYTAACITGAFLTSVIGEYGDNLPPILHGANLSVGASGGIFGLFGALLVYGQHMENHNLKEMAGKYALICFLFGFLFPGTDNWGHLGGFLGGYAMSRVLAFNLNCLPGHWYFLGAIACWGIVLGSISTSIIHGFFFFT